MTWPVQPIGPRTEPAVIAPVDPTDAVQRRRGRDEDDRQQQRRQRHEAPEPQQGPDADGHIDVLA